MRKSISRRCSKKSRKTQNTASQNSVLISVTSLPTSTARGTGATSKKIFQSLTGTLHLLFRQTLSLLPNNSFKPSPRRGRGQNPRFSDAGLIQVLGDTSESYFGVSVFWAFIAASLFFGSIPSLIAYDSKRLDHQIVFLLVLSFLSFLACSVSSCDSWRVSADNSFKPPLRGHGQNPPFPGWSA